MKTKIAEINLCILGDTLCVSAVSKRSNRKARQEYAKNAVLNKFFANFAKDFASWR